MDEEEYEHDIIWDSTKGLWVTTLKNGKYLISMRAKGYKELNEYIELKTGDKQFRYLCVPANQDVPTLTFQVINVENGKPIKNSFLELWKENN